MIEFDKRQFVIMLQKIEEYNEGHISLSSLINDLDALARILTVYDEAWNKQFFAFWLDLEEVYSVALAEEKKIDLNDKKIITAAIKNLKKLIELKLI